MNSDACERIVDLHDDGRNLDISFDALVRQDTSTIHVNLVTDGNIVTKDSDVFETSPATDGRSPAWTNVSKDRKVGSFYSPTMVDLIQA